MLLLFTLLACDPGAQATSACRDRRETLDTLYARYGGSDVVVAAKEGILGGAIGGVDRAQFEKKCVELGRGGSPSFGAQKAKDFFAEAATKKACVRVVDLEDKVKAANRELPADDQVTCP